MTIVSVPTRGRTLDHAAALYDLVEPWVMLGRQDEVNGRVIELLELKPWHRVLDIGCGTGLVTGMIARHLDPARGGGAVGIDAAGKMIEAALEHRGGPAGLPGNRAAGDTARGMTGFHVHEGLDACRSLSMVNGNAGNSVRSPAYPGPK